jgi:hypothetical protein
VSAPRHESEDGCRSGDVIQIVAEETVGLLVEHTERIEGEIAQGQPPTSAKPGRSRPISIASADRWTAASRSSAT